MKNNKLLFAISIALIAIGTIISYFAYTLSFVVSVFGASLAEVALSFDSVKNWRIILSIALIVLGAFINCIVIKSYVIKIISSVISIMLITAGIVISAIANKEAKA